MKKTFWVAMAMGLVPAAATASEVRVFPQEGLVRGETTLVCEDARDIIDAGTGAMLIENDTTKFLVITQNTFAGARIIGTAPIHSVIQKMESGRRMLVGRDLEFVLNTDSA